MTREEILKQIKQIAKNNGYELTDYAERIAEAKRRMGDDWNFCPCQRNNPFAYCISDECKAKIEKDGICHCSLYRKKK